jgi:CRISPR-associated protein Csm3
MKNPSQEVIKMFDKLESRLIIDYEVRVKSDLHIGGHESTAPGEIDNPVIKDGNDFPMIPGSSLKGVLRTEMERLLRGANKKACTPNNLCEPKDECTVCLLFGGQEYAGSIRIRDAITDSPKTVVRDGVMIDRGKRKAAEGRYYTSEVVPKGTVFNGQIMIENPRLDECKYAKLGALLGTCRFFNATCRSLGGAVSRGFGEVIIVPKIVREVTPSDYLNGNYKGNVISTLTSEEGLEEGELVMDKVDQFIDDWKNYLK